MNEKGKIQMEAEMRTDEHHIEKHNKFLALHNKHEIQLVFLGDSLTRRWEDNIDLWNKFFSEYNAVNFGVGGDCLENIKWRILNGELDGINPKILIFLAGTNNLDKDSTDEIIDGIHEIAGIIQEKLQHTKVVVLALLPRNNNETGIDFAQKINKINNELRTKFWGAEREFKDIGADLIDEKGIVRQAIMPDGLHLNYQGYEVIGPILKSIIDELW